MQTLSIIVLTYNHQNFVRQNLEGIFMQKMNFPVELILCDDHSTDNTDAVIQEILIKKPQNITVKYTRHDKNLGSTPNFYFALKQVTGKYVAFCEGDDYWTDEKKLQKQLDFLQNHQEYALCFHNAVNISDHSEYNQTLFAHIENREYSPEEIYRHWTVHTATVMMRSEVLKTDAFKKTVTDPTLLYFDTVLFLAASTMGKLRGFSEVMSAYRRHESGLSFGPKNFTRDLKHNKLDRIIGNYHQKEIKKIADWHIFTRSRSGFLEALKSRNFTLARGFLGWILGKYKIAIIYLIKIWQH